MIRRHGWRRQQVDMADTRLMTRIALIDEIKRLREAVALYQEIEDDRAFDAAKRGPIIEGEVLQ